MTTNEEKRMRCTHIKKNNEQCKLKAAKGMDTCKIHAKKDLSPMVNFLTNLLGETFDMENEAKDLLKSVLEKNSQKIYNVTTGRSLSQTKSGPKKPLNSYNFFFKEKKKEDKGKSIKEIASEWRELKKTPEKLKKYQDLSDEDKKRYYQEIGKTPPKPTTPPKVIGIRNAYIWYCKENRERIKQENPEMKARDITKKLGAEWKVLNDDEKTPYREKFEQDKVRYAKETFELSDDMDDDLL